MLVWQEFVAVSDVNLEHRADQSIANGPDVAPGRVQGLLNVRPQLEDQLEAHCCVPGVCHLQLRRVLGDVESLYVEGIVQLSEVVRVRYPLLYQPLPRLRLRILIPHPCLTAILPSSAFASAAPIL